VRVYVALDKADYASLSDSTTEFHFTVADTGNGTLAEHGANFQGPER
jgi:hypothetical protein